MGDYFADFLDGCFKGLEDFFNSFWDASENAIEVVLNESGKSIVGSVDAYKNLIIKEYEAAYRKIKDDRDKTIDKIRDELTDPKEIERSIKKTDELKARREQKLKDKKEKQLTKLQNAKERWVKKLNG
jgi:hypothetical protein